MREPSTDGPTISGLVFVPERGLEGCRSLLRFHFEPGKGEPARDVTTWTLSAETASGGSSSSLRLAGSGPLGPKASGDASIGVTFQYRGMYRYYVQVQDEAGRWSNVLSAEISVKPRSRHFPEVCP